MHIRVLNDWFTGTSEDFDSYEFRIIQPYYLLPSFVGDNIEERNPLPCGRLAAVLANLYAQFVRIDPLLKFCFLPWM
jgi:hypothetical protein